MSNSESMIKSADIYAVDAFGDRVPRHGHIGEGGKIYFNLSFTGGQIQNYQVWVRGDASRLDVSNALHWLADQILKPKLEM